MATTERRPRIPADLAEQIDKLRDSSFESYVRYVLERHVDHNLGPSDNDYQDERGTERRHTFTDSEGAVLYIDKPTERKTPEGTRALLVVSDEDYEAVGVYLDEAEIRSLRDVCTELLGEYGE